MQTFQPELEENNRLSNQFNSISPGNEVLSSEPTTTSLPRHLKFFVVATFFILVFIFGTLAFYLWKFFSPPSEQNTLPALTSTPQVFSESPEAVKALVNTDFRFLLQEIMTKAFSADILWQDILDSSSVDFTFAPWLKGRKGLFVQGTTAETIDSYSFINESYLFSKGWSGGRSGDSPFGTVYDYGSQDQQYIQAWYTQQNGQPTRVYLFLETER